MTPVQETDRERALQLLAELEARGAQVTLWSTGHITVDPASALDQAAMTRLAQLAPAMRLVLGGVAQVSDLRAARLWAAAHARVLVPLGVAGGVAAFDATWRNESVMEACWRVWDAMRGPGLEEAVDAFEGALRAAVTALDPSSPPPPASSPTRGLQPRSPRKTRLQGRKTGRNGRKTPEKGPSDPER